METRGLAFYVTQCQATKHPLDSHTHPLKCIPGVEFARTQQLVVSWSIQRVQLSR